jgi:hypothetical protein
MSDGSGKNRNPARRAVVSLPVAEAAFSHWAVTPRAEALRELTSGLRFAAAVFRLKDDLRI